MDVADEWTGMMNEAQGYSTFWRFGCSFVVA